VPAVVHRTRESRAGGTCDLDPRGRATTPVAWAAQWRRRTVASESARRGSPSCAHPAPRDVGPRLHVGAPRADGGTGRRAWQWRRATNRPAPLLRCIGEWARRGAVRGTPASD